jgi:RHS repeat-associated protein
VKLVYDRDDRVVERRSNAGGTAVPDAVTKTSWDALGRLKRLDRPENVWEEYSYEGASPLPLSRLDGRQISTAWQYTATGQVKRVGAGGVDTTQWLYRDFTYDALGRLIEARDNGSTADATDDVVTWLRWDSLGGKRKEWSSVLGESLAIQHSFDGTGALVASVLGSTSVSWSRDELGRLKSLWAGFISGGPDVQLTYDGLGGPATRIYGNGNKTSFTYDELGQLIELGDTNQQNVKFAGWSWQVPIDGVPRTARFHRGWTATMSAYVNDGGDRLMIEDHGIAPPVVPATITASTSGYAANVATAQYLKTGKGLGPTGWGSGGAGQAWRAYKLDGRSNWVQRAGGLAALNVAPTLNLLDAYKAFQSPISYNADGSVKSVGSSEAYTYNALGELTDVQVGALKKHYTYDALGRRVSEASIAGSVTTPTRYGYDGPRRTLRLLPGQSLPEVTVDGDGLDQHLMRITPSGAKQYYHQDRSNSVYLVTDANGAPLEWYQYTAYGEMTVLSANGLAISASAIGNRFGYQGQPFDLDTGLVDMRARFYRPGWGRFVQPDPIGFAGGSNLFGFVGSAPMKWWDPMGLDRDNFRSSPFDAGVPENELHTTQEGAGVDNLIPGTPCEDVGDCELPTWLTKGTYPFRFVLGAGFDSVAGGLNGLFPGIAPNGPAFGHSNFFYGAQLISSSLGQATDYAAIGVGTAGAAGGGTAAVASGGTLALPGAALAAGGVAVAGAGYHMLPLHQNAAQDAWDNLFRKDGDDSNSGSGSVWKMKEVEGLDGQPQRVYQRDDLIDPGLKDKYGRTNFSRMKQGLAPIGPDGIEINVHHMLQTADGPLAELTATFHRTLSKP